FLSFEALQVSQMALFSADNAAKLTLLMGALCEAKVGSDTLKREKPLKDFTQGQCALRRQ
ncbi:MAG: hypothetical protein ACRDDA_02755, partial [Aeromonas sp.]